MSALAEWDEPMRGLRSVRPDELVAACTVAQGARCRRRFGVVSPPARMAGRSDPNGKNYDDADDAEATGYCLTLGRELSRNDPGLLWNSLGTLWLPEAVPKNNHARWERSSRCKVGSGRLRVIGVIVAPNKGRTPLKPIQAGPAGQRWILSPASTRARDPSPRHAAPEASSPARKRSPGSSDQPRTSAGPATERRTTTMTSPA